METLPESWILAACLLCKEKAALLPCQDFSGAGLQTVAIRPSGGPAMFDMFDPYRNIPRINRGMVYLRRR